MEYRDQIRILEHQAIEKFARYLAKTILHYLGSDVVPPYFSLEKKLREGVRYEYKKLHLELERKIRLPLSATHAEAHWQAGLFTAARIVKRTGIRTADGRFFKPPWGLDGPEKYGYRLGTIEEAIRADYSEIRFKQ